jgi:hypothetical protein
MKCRGEVLQGDSSGVVFESLSIAIVNQQRAGQMGAQKSSDLTGCVVTKELKAALAEDTLHGCIL